MAFDEVYVNTSERYGQFQVLVTIEDFQELNPAGKFERTHRDGRDVIIERDYDGKGHDEIVAETRSTQE